MYLQKEKAQKNLLFVDILKPRIRIRNKMSQIHNTGSPSSYTETTATSFSSLLVFLIFV
jgi:hypothetical protein